MSPSGPSPRVAIYNRWLNTAGGGEKHAGAIAEVLSRDHQVEFLTHDPVDLVAIAAIFELNLDRVRVRYVPDSTDVVSRASADYDLFINASHLDYVAPRARQNALVVYFPATSVASATALGSYNRAKNLVRRSVSRVFGRSVLVVLRRLVFASAAQSSDQTWIGRLAVRGFGRLSASADQNDRIDGYGVILAISEYTRRWVQRYWHRDSFVLYPRIPAIVGDLAAKRPSILTVGRFFAGNHNKKHVDLIRAFRSIEDELPGWRLHVAGGYQPTESNAAYLRSVEAAAQGDAAVELHVNCTGSALAALYRESRLYWHATGFGENEQEHPDRFEHFGITAVEAMAAGCVPLVLGAGGLPEIVRPGVDGVIWNSLAELKRETIDLSRDSARWDRLSQGATRRASDFDGLAFDRRLAEAVRQLGVANVRR